MQPPPWIVRGHRLARFQRPFLKSKDLSAAPSPDDLYSTTTLRPVSSDLLTSSGPAGNRTRVRKCYSPTVLRA